MSDTYRTEEFRLVQDFPGYRVSTFGRVQTCHKHGSRTGELSDEWRDLASAVVSHPHGKRYRGVMLYRKGRGHHFLVHRLVLETFVGPCPNGQQGCHGDDNPENNRLDNLRWDTPKGNMADAIRSGAMRRGGRHGMAKLTEEHVAEIKRLRREGSTLKPIAERFSVSIPTISLIVNGKVWQHVP